MRSTHRRFVRKVRRLLLAGVLAHASSLLAAPFAFIAGGGVSTGLVGVIDVATQSLVDHVIAVGPTPQAIAVHPNGERVYVVSLYENGAWGPGTVSVVRTRTLDVVATIKVGEAALAAAMSPSGDRLYVLNQLSHTLSIIDTASNRVVDTVSDISGRDLAVSPSGEHVYIADFNWIKVLSASERRVVRKFPMGHVTARGVAITPDGRHLYVAQYIDLDRGKISVIATSDGEVVAQIPADPWIYELVARGDGAKVYASDGTTISVIDAVTHTVTKQVAGGFGGRGLSLTEDNRYLYVANWGDSTVTVLDTLTDDVVKTIPMPNGAVTFGKFIAPSVPASGTAEVVEFHHSTLDHYFITQDAAEIADLDAARHAGWSRTGARFFAYLTGSVGPTHPVCRFYGLPSAGLDSHFYSASFGECNDVSLRFDSAWRKETGDAFRVTLPAADGSCPAGTVAVHRLWNARTDSNHRYTTNTFIREQMIAKGYVPEGYGRLGVAMCAPT